MPSTYIAGDLKIDFLVGPASPPTNIFVVGEEIPVRAVFSGGGAVPTGVTFCYSRPDGVALSTTVPQGDGTGKFWDGLIADMPGQWSAQVQSLTPLGKWAEIAFQVRASLLSAAVALATETSAPRTYAFFRPGQPAAAEIVVAIAVERPMVMPAGLAGSVARAGAASAAAKSFSLKKNGTAFGTVSFAAGGTAATLAAASAVTFSAGDLLTVIAPSVADATLADIAFTLVGTLG